MTSCYRSMGARLVGFQIGRDLNCSNLTSSFTLIAAGNLNATNGVIVCGTYLINGMRASVADPLAHEVH